MFKEFLMPKRINDKKNVICTKGDANLLKEHQHLLQKKLITLRDCAEDIMMQVKKLKS